MPIKIALILVAAALALAPSTGLAQKATPAKVQDKPVVAPTAPKDRPVVAPQPPFNAKVARRISPEDVKLRMDAGEKAAIVDTRSKFTGVIVKDAAHVTDDKLAAWSKDLPKDALIVAYCT